MNVRLKKTFKWSSAVVYESRFVINHYRADVTMITVSDDNEEQNIAYERSKMFIHGVMEDAILISQSNPRIEAYQNTDARLIALPQEPVDQIIGMMLYLKLNAIMENRIVVIDVSLSSSAGDSMYYLHSSGESLAPLDRDGWWTDARPCWYDTQEKTQDKVVNLSRVPEWKDQDLDWTDNNLTDNSVVFAKFGKNEEE